MNAAVPERLGPPVEDDLASQVASLLAGGRAGEALAAVAAALHAGARDPALYRLAALAGAEMGRGRTLLGHAIRFEVVAGTAAAHALWQEALRRTVARADWPLAGTILLRLLRLGDPGPCWPDVERVWAAIPAAAPDLVEAMLLAYARRGDLARARSLLAERMAGNPASPRLAGVLVSEALRQGRTEEALRIVQEGAVPDGDTLRELAVAVAGEGLTEDALGLTARLPADAAPSSAGLVRAEILRASGRLPAALGTLAALLRERPDDPRLLMSAMDWLQEADRPSDAARAGKALLAAQRAAGIPVAGRIARVAEEAEDATTARDAARAAHDEMKLPPEPREPAMASRAIGHLWHYDVAAARAVLAALPTLSPARRALSAVEAEIACTPGGQDLVEAGHNAFRDLDQRAEPGAVVLVLPWNGIDFFATDPEGRLLEEREVRAAFRTLAMTFDAFRRVGVSLRIVPSFGRVVPKGARGAAFTISYHTVSPGHSGLHIKSGPLPETLLIDPLGYSGWSAIARQSLDELPLVTVEESGAVAWMAAERRRVRDANLSKVAQAERGSMPAPSGRVVLLALQIPHDTVLRLARMDMFSLARAVVHRAAKSGVRVLVKRHPLCTDPRSAALLRELAAAPHVCVTTASIHDLLPAVDAVFAVNSGVGAEALLYGRAVHLSGAADYGHVCHQIADEDDIRLDEVAFRPPVPPGLLARYMYWYRNVHHVPLDVPGALERAVETRILGPALRAAERWRVERG